MTVRQQRKSRVGRVVSDKMNKTVVVLLERLTRHPRYHKTMRVRTKVKAHDEHNACHEGDIVRIEETRPLSKEKRWRVVAILQSTRGTTVTPRAEAASP